MCIYDHVCMYVCMPVCRKATCGIIAVCNPVKINHVYRKIELDKIKQHNFLLNWHGAV